MNRMKLIMSSWRYLINEHTQYDSHFKPLMDSGYEGILQAMELADQLGIPSQELPWSDGSITDYLYYEIEGRPGGSRLYGQAARDAYDRLLANTSMTYDEWVAAGQKEYENYESTLGLREATEYDSHFKILMDSGYEGIKEAMFLADSMGLSSQDLPWDHDTVIKYMMYGPESEVEDVLFVVGWTKKKMQDEGQKAHEEWKITREN